MATTEEIITKYSADEGDYVRGTNKAIGSTKSLAKTIGATQDQIARRQSRISKVSGGKFWKGLTDGLKMPKLGAGMDDFSNLGKLAIGSLVGVGVAAGAAGIDAMRRAADFESLVKALEAVEGQGERTKGILADLRELAKLPGIELNDTIQSFVNLRRSNIGEGFAKSLISELGNANAMSGGGQAEFSQVMRAITQIANKPFLQGDELVQLMEAGIPAYQLIKDIFGTTDTEELKRRGIDSRQVLEGLVKAMSKMPRVASGAKNEFENLGAAINQAFVSAGAALNTAFLPRIKEATKVLEEMTDAGVITRVFEDIASMLGGDGGPNSTEDLLFGILVEVKTMAAGFQNLIKNAEGAKGAVESFWEWLTKPRGGPELEEWERNKRNQDGSAPNLGEQRQGFINEMELEKERLRKDRERKGKGKSPTSPTKPAEKTLAEISNPILQTAQNTSRMVQLQQKQNEISAAIIGGTSRPGVTPVELGAMGRPRGGLDAAIRNLASMFYQEGQNVVLSNLMAQQRRGR